MDHLRQIAILGLGFMGSSLAASLKKRGFPGKIRVYARQTTTRVQALERGIADAVFSDPSEAVREAGLIVICVPIRAISGLTEQIVSTLPPRSVVTDVGSTKSKLLKVVEPLFQDIPACFIGSHPIAGSEKSGIGACNPDLYKGRLTVVCPSSTVSQEAKEMVCGLWKSAGSDVVEMLPEQHDAMLASTSHLPHMIAAALARSISDGRPACKADFCGTGFQDTTRVASGSADMWADIIDTNRTALETELDRFHKELREMIRILRNGKDGDIRRWLEEAAFERNQILNLNRFLKR